MTVYCCFLFFFFNDTATTEIYTSSHTLSLHDALPIRASLERMSKSEDPHPSHGWKLRYSNPATRRDPFPTMVVFMQWLPKGFAGRKHRSTDGGVYCVVDGRGRADI